MTSLPHHRLTYGGLLGNTTGYTGGRGISEGTGKDVNPVDEVGIELVAIEVAEVFVTNDTLNGDIWVTVGRALGIPELLSSGWSPGAEFASVTRSLSARTQVSKAQCQWWECMVERRS